MRQKFIQTTIRKEAEEACPWAAEIIECDGGFQCFESVDDAARWQAQE